MKQAMCTNDNSRGKHFILFLMIQYWSKKTKIHVNKYLKKKYPNLLKIILNYMIKLTKKVRLKFPSSFYRAALWNVLKILVLQCWHFYQTEKSDSLSEIIFWNICWNTYFNKKKTYFCCTTYLILLFFFNLIISISSDK